MCPTGKLMRWPLVVAFLFVCVACAQHSGRARPTTPPASASAAPSGPPGPEPSVTVNAGPSGSPGPEPSATGAPAAGHGFVRGLVVRPPGGDPRSGHGGGSVPVSGDPVHAYDAAGRVVASAVSARDGRFRLSVPAGTYRVAEDICGSAAQVRVTTGATVPVTLTVPNRC